MDQIYEADLKSNGQIKESRGSRSEMCDFINNLTPGDSDKSSGWDGESYKDFWVIFLKTWH